MDFHKPTKDLLDQICREEGINAFGDPFDRERLVSKALTRLGFNIEAEAMMAIGRPKKGELSRKETVAKMRKSRNPALRYLSFVVAPTKAQSATNQNWLYRLVQKLIDSGMTPGQAAWQLQKSLTGFAYRDIRKAYQREEEKLKKE